MITQGYRFGFDSMEKDDGVFKNQLQTDCMLNNTSSPLEAEDLLWQGVLKPSF